MRFPHASVRGIAFSLSTWEEETWTPAFYLIADSGELSDDEPGWWRAEDSENRGWHQVAIEGEGPDRVLIPDVAAPGEYLLCTANAVDEACALLTVTG